MGMVWTVMRPSLLVVIRVGGLYTSLESLSTAGVGKEKRLLCAYPKKCHSLKNLVVISETRHIGFLSHTCEGKASDKSLAELEGYTLPRGSWLYQDNGFQGFLPPDIKFVQPKKRPSER
jgi:hypothetical protein